MEWYAQVLKVNNYHPGILQSAKQFKDGANQRSLDKQRLIEFAFNWPSLKEWQKEIYLRNENWTQKKEYDIRKSDEW